MGWGGVVFSSNNTLRSRGRCESDTLVDPQFLRRGSAYHTVPGTMRTAARLHLPDPETDTSQLTCCALLCTASLVTASVTPELSPGQGRTGHRISRPCRASSFPDSKWAAQLHHYSPVSRASQHSGLKTTYTEMCLQTGAGTVIHYILLTPLLYNMVVRTYKPVSMYLLIYKEHRK